LSVVGGVCGGGVVDGVGVDGSCGSGRGVVNDGRGGGSGGAAGGSSDGSVVVHCKYLLLIKSTKLYI